MGASATDVRLKWVLVRISPQSQKRCRGGYLPYTLMSPAPLVFGCSAWGDEVLRSAASFSLSAAAEAAAASSSNFFFLNRVSVMGRKNVHSKEYCLQCWHTGGSASGRMSHL